MPRRCSSRRRALVWLSRAVRLRCWVYWMVLAARCRRAGRSSGLRDQVSMRALAAVRTWQSVISGFFPPQPLALLGKEEMADLGDQQVSADGLILADLEMGQAELGFLVLEAAFDGPAGEGDMEQGSVVAVVTGSGFRETGILVGSLKPQRVPIDAASGTAALAGILEG